MIKYLMTQSLLSAYGWIFKIENGYDDFLKTLNRKSIPPNTAMLNGIHFENMITAYCEGVPLDESHKWAAGIRQIGDIVKHGAFQISLSKTNAIENTLFLLYGKLDALKAGTIYDIKFSEKYKQNKYMDSPQHSMYLELCPSAERFVYLVSDGAEVFTETYLRDDITPIQQEIKGFMRYIDEQGLTDTYCQLWQAKK